MNARCERILGRRHLVHVLRAYSFGYFNTARPHQGIGQRIPAPAATKKYTEGATVRAIPVLAGLHHDYVVEALAPCTAKQVAA
jgi:hypothetical protein